MGKIKVLSKQLADKIAAGEVVERPASVVKELVENSLDAGSSSIQVIIEQSGLKSIKVIDDGQGIEPDDLPKACLRHATSKIIMDSDLNAIKTLGFRGEALASIAAVSRLVICSKHENSQQAFQIRSTGGEIKSAVDAARTKGTTVEVNDLFFNTPARLKFLKSNTTEAAHIIRVMTELALANPETGFQLIHNNKQLINCEKAQSVKQRTEILLGKEFTDELIPINLNLGPLKIGGFIGKAGGGIASRKNQYLFVNKRAVVDKTVSHAIIQGYHTFLMERKFPSALIFIQTPPELVDVNVHPAKREIRFQDSALLHDTLAKLIKDTLSKKDYLPGILTQTPVSDRVFRPYAGEGSSARSFTGSSSATARHQSSGFEPLNRKDDAERLFSYSEQKTVFSEAGDYLQANKTYIITKDETGIVIIDQHAAHERIIFDRLLEGFKQKKIEKQKLLLPVTIHLSAGEFVLFEQHKQTFAQLGFDIEDFGDNTIAVYAFPVVLGKIDIKSELQAIIGDLGEFDLDPDIDKKVVQFLAPIACHSAIRANETLSEQKIGSLLHQLRQTSSPQTCPHGRPTMINISWPELEKRFKRK
jgi:DNA mismatch repair protein MutL